MAKIRSSEIGFVFQSFNLVAGTNAIRNVELPLVYAGVRARHNPARLALEQVGLVIITHEEEIAQFAKQVLRMRDGHIEGDQVQRGRTEARG